MYGDGGAVASRTGGPRPARKPAAVFMPSGTMAQQIALRIHADRRGRRSSPSTRPATSSSTRTRLPASARSRRPTVGDPRSLITLCDLEAIDEPLAAVVLELPQREIGGQLPAWDDLVAQVGHARDRGALSTSMAPGSGRRALLRAAAGRDRGPVRQRLRLVLQGSWRRSPAAALGDEDVIAEARAVAPSPWRHAVQAVAVCRVRAGGPSPAPAQMTEYLDHARAIAAALTGSTASASSRIRLRRT